MTGRLRRDLDSCIHPASPFGRVCGRQQARVESYPRATGYGLQSCVAFRSERCTHDTATTRDQRAIGSSQWIRGSKSNMGDWDVSFYRQLHGDCLDPRPSVHSIRVGQIQVSS